MGDKFFSNMRKFLLLLSALTFCGSLMLPVLSNSVQAVNFWDKYTYPVDYQSPTVLGRGTKSPYSIDRCLEHKQRHFNEDFNIWVEAMVRCEYNETKGVLSTVGDDGVVSSAPAGEEKCRNMRDNDILSQGAPSEQMARRWSERCSYLGTIGGAGPIVPDSSSDDFGSDSSSSRLGVPRRTPPTTPTPTATPTPTPKPPASGAGGAGAGGAKTPAAVPTGAVYSGGGVKVPTADKAPEGISKQTSLITLLIFYTSATLPYVSVISILVFVAAGLFYILSAASEELHTKAKTMMTYTVIGIIIILSSYAVVNTLLRFVAPETPSASIVRYLS